MQEPSIQHKQVEAASSQALALLLDDNLMSTMRLEPQLRRMNYRVQTAQSLPESASASVETQPSLVLINLGSRNLDGASLVQTIRERFPQARVIGFCGHLEVEIRRAAKAAGIDKILTNEQALSNLQQFI